MKASGTVRRSLQGKGPENVSRTEWGAPGGGVGRVGGARSQRGAARSRPTCAANMAATAGAAWGGRSVTRAGSGIASSRIASSSLLSRGREMLHGVEARATGPRRVSEPRFSQLHSRRGGRQ